MADETRPTTAAEIDGAIRSLQAGGHPEPDAILVHPDIVARARDLAELGDYVRLLAGRMGLVGWTFDVVQDPPDDCSDLVFLRDIRYDFDLDTGAAAVHVSDDFFDHTPEDRRYCLVTWLMECHFAHLDERERLHLDAGYMDIAAAWAPCLPLPLVGLMRRAGG